MRKELSMPVEAAAPAQSGNFFMQRISTCRRKRSGNAETEDS